MNMYRQNAMPDVAPRPRHGDWIIWSVSVILMLFMALCVVGVALSIVHDRHREANRIARAYDAGRADAAADGCVRQPRLEEPVK